MKIKKPTKEQYEQAKKGIDMFRYCADKARVAQERLIDDLARARQDEITCMAEAERCAETILQYEVWSMTESEGEG